MSQQIIDIVLDLSPNEEITFYRSAVGQHVHIRLKDIKTMKSKHQALPIDHHLSTESILRLVNWLREKLKS